MATPKSFLGWLSALVLLFCLLPAAWAADTPSERIHIYVGAPGNNKLPIALPTPIGDADASEFISVLRRDLALSGWFELIDPAAHIEPVGTGIQPGEFQYEDWDVPGAAVLGKTALRRTADGSLRAEVFSYHVPGRRKLGGRAFTASADRVRTLAHKAADEIIWRVTGQRGPFNTRFAFSGSFAGSKQIYVVDFDGHGRRAITKNGSINLGPSWDPSGSKVAFTSFLAGNPDLYVADLGAGRIQRLSARKGINSGAAWHPSGGLMALTLAPTGDPDLYTIDPTTGRQIARLSNSRGIDASPTWSPDGTQIAFVSERSGGAQIYVMNADGSGVRRVSFAGSHNTDPAWSPDGQTIAFVSRDGVFDVFTVKVDGTGLRRITQSAGDNEDPSWSPDGAYLAFSSTRTGSAHIWLSTADGHHQAQLTQGKGGYTNPTWSPALDW